MKRIYATLLATLLSASAFAATDPAAITVPAGNKLALTLLGAGDLTYECKAKADMPGAHEWTFAGPNAVLYDKTSKAAVGKYYAGPTWEANDGSKVGGKQLGVSPSMNAASIPLQLVQAGASTGTGAMSGITFIQRMNTKGGVAPKDACGAANVGAKTTVKYEADYLFYKAM
jgi:hypothetical protein